jgi:ubiquinone/menaquinone biosynthesis C-methylase UbiE
MNMTFIRCPDCAGKIDNQLVCTACQRRIEHQDGCVNALPSDLSENKLGEDSVFALDSSELAKFEGKPWRKIVGRLEIERFEKEIIPILPQGNFIELAGESCWASAIYKSTYPSATVFATDVSPNAISRIAIPTCKMFPHLPDVFAAVDAERLPFDDESFDCIFIQAAMHHMPEPVKMLSEVKRVLKKGGRFVAVDHAVPAHFRFLFSSTAEERANAHNIQEELVSFRNWKDYFSRAGIPLSSMRVYSNPAYQRNPIFAIVGRMISVLPDSMKSLLFPVGLYVVYDKK